MEQLDVNRQYEHPHLGDFAINGTIPGKVGIYSHSMKRFFVIELDVNGNEITLNVGNINLLDDDRRDLIFQTVFMSLRDDGFLSHVSHYSADKMTIRFLKAEVQD